MEANLLCLILGGAMVSIGVWIGMQKRPHVNHIFLKLESTYEQIKEDSIDESVDEKDPDWWKKR